MLTATLLEPSTVSHNLSRVALCRIDPEQHAGHRQHRPARWVPDICSTLNRAHAVFTSAITLATGHTRAHSCCGVSCGAQFAYSRLSSDTLGPARRWHCVQADLFPCLLPSATVFCHMQQQVLAQQQLMAAAHGQHQRQQQTHRCLGTRMILPSTLFGMCGATGHTLMLTQRCADRDCAYDPVQSVTSPTWQAHVPGQALLQPTTQLVNST